MANLYYNNHNNNYNNNKRMYPGERILRSKCVIVVQSTVKFRAIGVPSKIPRLSDPGGNELQKKKKRFPLPPVSSSSSSSSIFELQIGRRQTRHNFAPRRAAWKFNWLIKGTNLATGKGYQSKFIDSDYSRGQNSLGRRDVISKLALNEFFLSPSLCF